MKKFGPFLALATITLATLGSPSVTYAQLDQITFKLKPNPDILECLRQDADHLPKAKVTVTRGRRNDTLEIELSHIKPGLAFDLFTVERTLLLNDGSKDPGFHGFGLAWYQSDLKVQKVVPFVGEGFVTIKTILLDQIFGFDPDVGLNPTNTFHVGFWFNDPNDAAACGFNVNNPTPFNGEHNAGPLAMISVPDATTGLGPLCTNPDGSGGCNP